MEDCLEEERYGKPSFNAILPCANFRKTVCCENLIGLLSKINRHLKLLSFLLSGFHVGILFFLLLCEVCEMLKFVSNLTELALFYCNNFSSLPLEERNMFCALCTSSAHNEEGRGGY